MATRFAGDFFGLSLASPEKETSSLFRYFPDLRTLGSKSPVERKREQDGARLFGNAQAVSPFTGFKTFEKPQGQYRAAPVFSGFKTFEQPKQAKAPDVPRQNPDELDPVIREFFGAN